MIMGGNILNIQYRGNIEIMQYDHMIWKILSPIFCFFLYIPKANKPTVARASQNPLSTNRILECSAKLPEKEIHTFGAMSRLRIMRS